MKQVLITGAGSYIGTKMEQYLVQFPDLFRVETLDVRGEEWKNADFSPFDAVFHVAALVHDAKSKDDAAQWPRYKAVNTDLALAVAEKAKKAGVKQFLFMSTAAVYGIDGKVGKPVVITADTPLEPKDNYGKSKLLAEQGLLGMMDDGFKVVILRPPMIYGKGCKGNYVSLSRLAGKMPVFPKVKNQRSMLHIDNFVEFLCLMIENEDSGIFCPQNRKYTNTSQLVQTIRAVRGKETLLIPGFGWVVRLLGHVTPLAEKAFGNWCYDWSLSDYRNDYQVWTIGESIEKTET